MMPRGDKLWGGEETPRYGLRGTTLLTVLSPRMDKRR